MPDSSVKAPLRILTANLLGGRADPAALVDLVERMQIDVVCVQESTPDLAEALAEVLPAGGIESGPISRGLGIAARRPVEIETFPLPKRGGFVARLDPSHWSDLDHAIQIVNVHIMAPQTWPYFPNRHTRHGQMNGLLEFLDRAPQTPRAILGDFNASPLWPVYRRMASRYTDAAAACAGRGASPRATWPNLSAVGLGALIRIDHCFVSRLTPLRTQVVPIEGSDHCGLCVDLSI